MVGRFGLSYEAFLTAEASAKEVAKNGPQSAELHYDGATTQQRLFGDEQPYRAFP